MPGCETNAISVAFDDGLRRVSVARAAILAPVRQYVMRVLKLQLYNVTKKHILITVLLLFE